MGCGVSKRLFFQGRIISSLAVCESVRSIDAQLGVLYLSSSVVVVVDVSREKTGEQHLIKASRPDRSDGSFP